MHEKQGDRAPRNIFHGRMSEREREAERMEERKK